MAFFCLGGLLSGLISGKTTPRTRVMISAACILVGFLVTSRLTGESIVPLYIAYGIVCGTGIGFTYNTVISVTSAWFPDRKGMCFGVLLMAFGFSTLILGNVADRMMNSPMIGWRATFVILGVTIAIVLFAASFFISEPEPGTQFPKPKKIERKGEVSFEQRDYTGLEMIRRLSFWKILVFFILLASVGNTAISFAKDFAMEVGASAGFAVLLVGMLSICNGLGRICSGAFFDMCGIRATQILTSACVIAATSVGLIASLTHALWLGVLALCMCGFSYGFSPTISAAFVSAFYGQKHYAVNFSIKNLDMLFASVSAAIAGSIITATDSYVPVFCMLLGFSIVGLIINLTIKKP